MSRPSSSDGVRPVQKKPPKFAARRKARGIPIGSGDGRTARHGPPERGIDVESYESRSDVARAESITGPDGGNDNLIWPHRDDQNWPHPMDVISSLWQLPSSPG